VLLAPQAAGLPQVPRLTGRDDFTARIVALKPDLIVDYGTVSPRYSDLARTSQQRTGIPTILLDGSLNNIPVAFRTLRRVLHRQDRAETLARFAEALLVLPTSHLTHSTVTHPTVSCARGADGLTVDAPGTDITELFAQLSWHVVAPAGRGPFRQADIAEIHGLDPDVMAFSDPAMHATLAHSATWQALRAAMTRQSVCAVRLTTSWRHTMSEPRETARSHVPATIVARAGISAKRRALFQLGIGLVFASGLLLQAPAASASGTVNVLYAGSLVNLMEHGIGPAFDKATGDQFQGFAGGSNKVANEIKGKLRQGDVFVSANPKVNDDLMGAANGDWVRWYIAFAQSPLVIGYNPSSKFAKDFRTMPWYKVLEQPGIRIGRTDPKLDPKGRLTVQLMKQAASHYKIADLEQRTLGAPENSAQVLPEETLVGRLQSGQLDVGFFYSTETSDAKIPAVHLPAAVTPKAVYTMTVLHNAPNPGGAEQFVAFLLDRQGQALMHEHGLALRKPDVTGDAAAVPQAIRATLPKTK
jgi:molybdate/tungstate transport system substrate-binding protein